MFVFSYNCGIKQTNRNSFWDFLLQLLYTQVGMTGQWDLEFPWGCGRFLHLEVSSIRSRFKNVFSSWGKKKITLKSEKDADIVFVLCLLKPFATTLLLPFPLPAFPNLFYTDLLLPGKHPSVSQMETLLYTACRVQQVGPPTDPEVSSQA